MSNVPTLKLSDGNQIPMIGFGCFGGHDGPEKVYESVKTALKLGYRHFDTAYIYNTEKELGKAIQESEIPRQELFITSKLWPNFHEPQHVEPALDRTLQNLQMTYLDLYLIHWPLSLPFSTYHHRPIDPTEKPTHLPLIQTWRVLESLVRIGKIKSIGVSNLTQPMLEDLWRQAEIKPVMHQIEIHPALPQVELVKYCQSLGIGLTAYSPLANPGLTDVLDIQQEQVVLEVAAKVGKTPAQVVLNWGLARGYCVIPKTVRESRLKENLVWFELETDDVERITAIGKGRTRRVCDPVEVFNSDYDYYN